MRALPAAGVLILALLCGTPVSRAGRRQGPILRSATGRGCSMRATSSPTRGSTPRRSSATSARSRASCRSLRKIPFLHEVKRDVTKRENLKAMLLKELDEDMTPEEFRANEMAMKAFGLLPRDYQPQGGPGPGLLRGDRRLLRPQDQDDAPDQGAQEGRAEEEAGLPRAALRQDDGFDKDENKTVIAHELTHALADQHYDLDALQKAVKKDDDRSMALSALIEGEATLTMLGAGMDDWDGIGDRRSCPPPSLDWTFRMMSPFMPIWAAASSLRKAPAIISESMIFPYFKGVVFCARLTNDGGWKAIDEAYRSLPQSTEQILHPEKYRDQPGPADGDRPGRR